MTRIFIFFYGLALSIVGLILSLGAAEHDMSIMAALSMVLALLGVTAMAACVFSRT